MMMVMMMVVMMTVLVLVLVLVVVKKVTVVEKVAVGPNVANNERLRRFLLFPAITPVTQINGSTLLRQEEN